MFNIPTPPLPCNAVYYRKEIRWNDNGTKYFVPFAIDVVVIAETEKSFKIKLGERESWVGKNKIRFSYLKDQDYCSKKQRRMPACACRICYEYCALRGKDMPRSY